MNLKIAMIRSPFALAAVVPAQAQMVAMSSKMIGITKMSDAAASSPDNIFFPPGGKHITSQAEVKSSILDVS